MFGHEEEAKLTGLDVLRLRLVQRQYGRSNVFYRMFFDKHYRPNRYDCIVHDQKKHKNINEFRTFVMHKYHRFPVASTTFLQLGGHQRDFTQQDEVGADPRSESESTEKAGAADSRESRQNVLIEGRLLRYYNRLFLSEMLLYGIAFGTVVFLGGSYLAGHLNLKVANYCFIGPGLVVSAANVYGRGFHNKANEEQIKDIYRAEYTAYDKFFRDRGYEEL